MISKNPDAWINYDFESKKYFDIYSKLYFSNIHKPFIKFLPNTNKKILDIGCGSGRDALSLARRGFQVTAVDPSIEMLALAKEKNNHKNIQWLNDSLPKLSKLKQNKYDFILISAVWMHVSPWEREVSINRISDLMKTGAHLGMTLRLGPPDPTRMMYPISADELLAQAKKANLAPIYLSRETKDSLKRNEITWRKVVFQKVNYRPNQLKSDEPKN